MVYREWPPGFPVWPGWLRPWDVLAGDGARLAGGPAVAADPPAVAEPRGAG